MKNKVLSNTKFLLSVIGTIFGHPILIVVGTFLTLYFQNYLNLTFDLNLGTTATTTSIIIFPLVLVFLTFIRYCFFYFWNYERIKHLSFIDGFRFFVSFQLNQIAFFPIYILIQLNDLQLKSSGSIVLAIFFFGVIIVGLVVFVYTQVRLYKYEKFDFNKEK